MDASFTEVMRTETDRMLDACTRCGDCVRACPEPRVLDFKDCTLRGFVAAGECTNCGECVAVCPEKALRFDLFARARARGTPVPAPTEGNAP
jgi:Pyruvate/2-oxoacid:ferredoxin oxidoreductase delta subunit